MCQNSIYLDTHAVVLLYAKDLKKFGVQSLYLMKNNHLLISPMVKLELQYLHEIRRINPSPDKVLSDLKNSVNLNICQKNWQDIVNISVNCSFTRDAFDRLIVAHAMLDNSILISKDERLTQHYANCIW